MSFDQLRYFVAVAENGTTRSAAAAVRVSQPPLSRQVKALEEELGTPLFERSSRGMSLNAAGANFLVHARGILSAVDHAVSAAREFRAVETQTRSPGSVEPGTRA